MLFSRFFRSGHNLCKVSELPWDLYTNSTLSDKNHHIWYNSSENPFHFNWAIHFSNKLTVRKHINLVDENLKDFSGTQTNKFNLYDMKRYWTNPAHVLLKLLLGFHFEVLNLIVGRHRNLSCNYQVAAVSAMAIDTLF